MRKLLLTFFTSAMLLFGLGACVNAEQAISIKSVDGVGQYPENYPGTPHRAANEDPFISPTNAALVLIDYQPHILMGVKNIDHETLPDTVDEFGITQDHKNIIGNNAYALIKDDMSVEHFSLQGITLTGVKNAGGNEYDAAITVEHAGVTLQQITALGNISYYGSALSIHGNVNCAVEVDDFYGSGNGSDGYGIISFYYWPVLISAGRFYLCPTWLPLKCLFLFTNNCLDCQ